MCCLTRCYVTQCGWVWLDGCGRWQPFRLGNLGYLPADGSLAAAAVIGAARAHAVVVSVLTPAEVLIAARRLAGARPHLAAVASIVHHEDLWQLCRDELTGESTSAPTAGTSAAAGSA